MGGKLQNQPKEVISTQCTETHVYVIVISGSYIPHEDNIIIYF